MRFWIRILVVCLGAVIGAFAQTPSAPGSWRTVEQLPGVDFSGLTAAQKQTVLKLIRDQDCSCQCGMKVAECRLQDSNCYYSKSLANLAIEGIKSGKSAAEIKKSLAEGPSYTRPKLLEDPVSVPTAGAPVKGPADAKITLIEFSDFECPFCSEAFEQVHAIMAAYPGKIRLIYKQFPLPMHPHAAIAAKASLAAQEQGKFWEMHDELFSHSKRITRENIMAWAKMIGLNMDKFTADLDSHKFDKAIEKDIADGDKAGVFGTPSFFINGKHYNGPWDLASVKPILDAELKGAPVTQARAK